MNNYEKIKEYEAHKTPVPSYDEYEQLENWNRFTADYHALREEKEIAEYEKVELLEKVEQLKELLKECRNKWVCYKPYDRDQLLKRIDEVLK